MQTYTLKEISDQLGVSENEVLNIGIEEGILDQYGQPTQKGYDMGLFELPEMNVAHTVVLSKLDNETFLFSEIGVVMDRPNFINEATRLLSNGDEINIVRSVAVCESIDDLNIFLSDFQ